MRGGQRLRTLLYDITALDWNADLLDVFGVPAATLPARSPQIRVSGPQAVSPWCPTAHRLSR